MMRVEKLAWTHDDDIKLVEAVLRNVRHGKSVIAGVREYAESTNGLRSVDASKFRFHTQLKAQYHKAYEIAKREGKAYKEANQKRVNQDERFDHVMNNFIDGKEHAPPRDIELDDIHVLLKKFMYQEKNKQKDRDFELEVIKLREENAKLKESNKKLAKAFKDMESDYIELKQAIQVLKNVGIQIDTPTPKSATKYTVDSNGLVVKVE